MKRLLCLFLGHLWAPATLREVLGATVVQIYPGVRTLFRRCLRCRRVKEA